MRFDQVDIDAVQFAELNPKLHDLEQLAASEERYGFVEIPIISETSGRLVAGQGRIEALRALKQQGKPPPEGVEARDGRWFIDARFFKFRSDAEAQAYLFDSNNLGLTGFMPVDAARQWDVELYLKVLEELERLPVSVSAEGMAALVNEYRAEALGRESVSPGELMDQAEAWLQKYGVKVGDVWESGAHRLVCGDARDPRVWNALLDGTKAQLAVTSPPYGVGKEYEEKGIAPWLETVEPTIKLLCEHAAVVVWNISDLFSTASQFIEPTFAYSVRMFGERAYKPLWIRLWLKPGMNYSVYPYRIVTTKPVKQTEYLAAFGEDDVPTERLPDMDEFEWVMAFAHAKHRFVKRLTKAERREWGYSEVWKMDVVRANDFHPAMFPVDLPWRAIRMHSDTGAQVVDPFAGSGTTLVACEQSGRVGRGIEITSRYLAVELERLARLGLEPKRMREGAV